MSFERYLERRDLVPAGNSTIPVMSSGFLRCGPALTGAPAAAAAAGFGALA